MSNPGNGQRSYQMVDRFGRLPPGWKFGMISGVAVDSQDRVYYSQFEEEPPLLVFDREGNYLSSWGSDFMVMVHSIYISGDIVHMSDIGSHQVHRLTLDGKHLLDLGTRGQPSDTGCDRDGGEVPRAAGPFNRPTHLCPSPSGELYASDGYRNSRVHRFAADGSLISSWGEPGDAPGHFRVPHSVWVDRQGKVYVCDRENDRVQIFSPAGEFLDQWKDLHIPTDLFIDAHGAVFICEGGAQGNDNYITVRDLQGRVQAQWDTPPGHNMAVDSRGDIYLTIGLDKRVVKFIRSG